MMANRLNKDFYITRNGELQNLNTVIDAKQDSITTSTNAQLRSLKVCSMISAINDGDIQANDNISCASFNTGRISANSLSIAPDTDISAEFGRSKIGFVGYGGHAGFAHRNNMTQGGYALLQSSDGTTFLNSANGKSIRFRINNHEKMFLTSNGRLGIGTTNTEVSFQVENGLNYAT
jgi:hypothetical protein